MSFFFDHFKWPQCRPHAHGFVDRGGLLQHFHLCCAIKARCSVDRYDIICPHCSQHGDVLPSLRARYVFARRETGGWVGGGAR